MYAIRSYYGHIQESPLLLELFSGHGILMGKTALGQTDDKNRLPLEPLGGMNGGEDQPLRVHFQQIVPIVYIRRIQGGVRNNFV